MTVPWEMNLRDKNLPMNKKIMHQNLLEFKGVMDRVGIRHVMIFGGLLGLIREGKLIDYDDDVEFMCYYQDHRKMLDVVTRLKSRGFYVPDKNECPMNDHFIIRRGEKIEIWWMQKINLFEDVYEYIYDNTVRYPERFFNTTETVKFLDKDWEVPSDPKEFLELTYGKSWTVPNKNASYILGK